MKLLLTLLFICFGSLLCNANTSVSKNKNNKERSIGLILRVSAYEVQHPAEKSIALYEPC